MQKVKSLSIAALVLMVSFANAQSKQSNIIKMSKNKEALMAFYQKSLTVNKETTPTIVLNEILADRFISHSSVDNKDKKGTVGLFEFLWTLIPDMKWEPQEIINEGNQYVVRSRATGKPKGDFFGLSTDGNKSFEIMSIDILTIKNGKLIKAYHIEDWATAMKQLKGSI